MRVYKKDASDEQFLHELNMYLCNFPVQKGGCEEVADLPIIYITGMARSGTTILSQILSRHLDIGYITNIAARFWERPDIGIRLSQILLRENSVHNEFESSHGVTYSPAGPHEFGYFWGKWLGYSRFPRTSLNAEELCLLDKEGLRGELHSKILAVIRKPMLFKLPGSGFIAPFLTEVHPHSLFVNITRNPYDVARSVLHVRKALYGDYSAWFSMKPAAWPFEADNAGEEVGLQVRHVLREIEAGLGALGVCSLSLEYEQLCRNPLHVVERIASALERWGYSPKILRSDFPKLSMRAPLPLCADIEKGIKKGLGL